MSCNGNTGLLILWLTSLFGIIDRHRSVLIVGFDYHIFFHHCYFYVFSIHSILTLYFM